MIRFSEFIPSEPDRTQAPPAVTESLPTCFAVKQKTETNKASVFLVIWLGLPD